ncbi:MAG: isopentenyl phosphate kinase [Anaerolineaceae bacterium]|jgi:isopentenyl phosphate kinase
MNKELIFLKLGGSLITDKSQTETPLKDRIHMLLSELLSYRNEHANTQILLGHGSGSYGHHAAARYGTRNGVRDKYGWNGFVEVWRSARKLNEIVLSIGQQVNLPLISFPPSATIMAQGQQVETWNLAPITKALQSGIIPVVYGDVVFDQDLGGTILSTEELFYHLAAHLKPDRVLLAGIEKAVFADFPANQNPIRHIGKDAPLHNFLQGSQNQDVTGGMRSKVSQMQALCRQSNVCQVEIFPATDTGDLLLALNGQHSGTIIS